jgi:hypothetical protein
MYNLHSTWLAGAASTAALLEITDGLESEIFSTLKMLLLESTDT